MKKTIFTILICGVAVLEITSCGTKNEFEIGNKADIEVVQGDVSLSVKKETLKNTGSVLILKNHTG